MFIKTLMFPLVSMSEPYETFDSDGNIYQEGGSQAGTIIGWIIHAVLMIIAGYLCWIANSNGANGLVVPILTKILKTIFAIIFSYVYIFYYVCANVLFNKSNSSVGASNNIEMKSVVPVYTDTKFE